MKVRLEAALVNSTGAEHRYKGDVRGTHAHEVARVMEESSKRRATGVGTRGGMEMEHRPALERKG